MQVRQDGVLAELKASWQIMVAVIAGMCAMALPGYALGAFVGPLASHFGWSITQITGWLTAWSAGCILAAPLTGSLADRIGARRVILSSLAIMGVALALASILLQHLRDFYVLGFVVGACSAGVSAMTYGRIVTTRFERGLGTALGLMSMGIGISAVFGPRLLQQVIDSYGWPWGLRVLGILPLLILPWSLLHLEEGGGRASAQAPPPARAQQGHTRSTALRMPAFWLLAAGTLIYGVCVSGVSVNLIIYLTVQGESRAHAAAAAGLFGAATIVGRLGSGVALDRLRLHVALLMALLFVAEGSAFLVIGSAAQALLPLALIVFGLAVGSSGSCLAYCTARLFGRRYYSSIFGLLGLVMLYVGTGLGPPLFSALHNAFGHYDRVFIAWAALAFVAAPLFALVARTPFFAAER